MAAPSFLIHMKVVQIRRANECGRAVQWQPVCCPGSPCLPSLRVRPTALGGMVWKGPGLVLRGHNYRRQACSPWWPCSFLGSISIISDHYLNTSYASLCLCRFLVRQDCLHPRRVLACANPLLRPFLIKDKIACPFNV